jgi:hypothetical protein
LPNFAEKFRKLPNFAEKFRKLPKFYDFPEFGIKI